MGKQVHSEDVPEALQKHFAIHGAKMVEKENYKGQDVFYADGGPHHDATAENIEVADDKWIADLLLDEGEGEEL